jgi:hypothetical protein
LFWENRLRRKPRTDGNDYTYYSSEPVGKKNDDYHLKVSITGLI